MTTGSALYLLMVVATFVLFCAVLAYQSWQESRHAWDILPTSDADPNPGATV